MRITTGIRHKKDTATALAPELLATFTTAFSPISGLPLFCPGGGTGSTPAIGATLFGMTVEACGEISAVIEDGSCPITFPASPGKGDTGMPFEPAPNCLAAVATPAALADGQEAWHLDAKDCGSAD